MNKYVVSSSLIADINKGNERSFSLLYNCYYAYLCTFATTYVFRPEKAEEIVNDVFMKIWDNRSNMTFPIHFYLLQSVRNACLNHLRMLRNEQNAMDEYRLQLLDLHEYFCLNDNNPLSLLEFRELEKQVRMAVETLPAKCKKVFESYLYQGKSSQQIAADLDININTVRVQIKNALDRMKVVLGPKTVFLLYFLLSGKF